MLSCYFPFTFNGWHMSPCNEMQTLSSIDLLSLPKKKKKLDDKVYYRNHFYTRMRLTRVFKVKKERKQKRKTCVIMTKTDSTNPTALTSTASLRDMNSTLTVMVSLTDTAILISL